MIGCLRGELIFKQPPKLMLEVHGVGYELEAPMSTFYALPSCGEVTTVYTHLHVREDALTLFAFKQFAERTLFRMLIKVNGVGAKTALAILSGMDVETFRRCITAGDFDSLIRIPGIGRKTAERLVIEMRDRLQDEPHRLTDERVNGNGEVYSASPTEDAIAALIALGYKPNDANKMVSKVNANAKSSEEIIRQALRATFV